eukprot:TRINITY_DN3704_c0_g1_i2.p2 TRINITY_DN3704_c0_g1~~TRINITY_DN3704_c0_g1_i2.p2  ORF type:complete len:114 (+),score=8.88 TRINITY_DN3704_c0_g1_i2:686-1027(+)
MAGVAGVANHVTRMQFGECSDYEVADHFDVTEAEYGRRGIHGHCSGGYEGSLCAGSSKCGMVGTDVDGVGHCQEMARYHDYSDAMRQHFVGTRTGAGYVLWRCLKEAGVGEDP